MVYYRSSERLLFDLLEDTNMQVLKNTTEIRN